MIHSNDSIIKGRHCDALLLFCVLLLFYDIDSEPKAFSADDLLNERKAKESEDYGVITIIKL